jgi:hypothetical protein
MWTTKGDQSMADETKALNEADARVALEAVEALAFDPDPSGRIALVNMRDWQKALRMVLVALSGDKCMRCHARHPLAQIEAGSGYCAACCDVPCDVNGCGHPLGDHAVGADGVEDCGFSDDCDCGGFEDPGDAERSRR